MPFGRLMSPPPTGIPVHSPPCRVPRRWSDNAWYPEYYQHCCFRHTPQIHPGSASLLPRDSFRTPTPARSTATKSFSPATAPVSSTPLLMFSIEHDPSQNYIGVVHEGAVVVYETLASLVDTPGPWLSPSRPHLCSGCSGCCKHKWNDPLIRLHHPSTTTSAVTTTDTSEITVRSIEHLLLASPATTMLRIASLDNVAYLITWIRRASKNPYLRPCSPAISVP
ncbi:hypothetical protein BD779DRAFT_1519110 [Infundibulicybe gibba]|nr:hypothetical protein BD779DRAFT_1519110 [Infundibulicybe gibba]